MKKLFFILSMFACIFLLTGCTKNYKTIDEYSQAMKMVRNNNLSYAIEVKQSLKDMNIYYKSFIKGNKWKTDAIFENESNLISTMLYDGNEVLTYSNNMPYAVVSPVMKFIKNKDEETKRTIINSQNPVFVMINWEQLFDKKSFVTSEFVNNKDNRNGFDCRLIKFDNNSEICVSDELGISVYQRMVVDNPKNKDEKLEMTFDLVNIDTSELSDDTFTLPNGVTKMTMGNMLKQMTEMFKI